MRWDWEWMGVAKPVADFGYCVSQFETFAAVGKFGFHYHCLTHDLVDPLGGFTHEFVEGVFNVG